MPKIYYSEAFLENLKRTMPPPDRLALLMEISSRLMRGNPLIPNTILESGGVFSATRMSVESTSRSS